MVPFTVTQTVSPLIEIATVHAAGLVLSKTLGREVRLGDIVYLSDDGRRNQLLRSRDLSGGSPSSFIIKKVVAKSYDPSDSASWDTRRFLSDSAGAEFLSAVLSAPLSPRFYGGSHDLGFFILEDLGEHHSLVKPLLEQDAATAETALLAFSSCLGALHAGTVGRSATYERLLRARHSHAGVSAQPLTGLGERVNELQVRLDGLGIRAGAEYSGR